MLQLTPAQQKIATSKARFRFIRCGRRFGKTEFAIEDIVATAVHNEGKVLYIAPTQAQARDIIWDKIKRRVEDFALKINEQQLEIRVPNALGTESTIMLGSWEKVENLRGNEFVHIVLDEVREMKKAPGFKYYWENALEPTLLTTNGTADFLSTPNGYDHFYTLEQTFTGNPEWDFFHFTSYDNPYNPPDDLEKLKRERPEEVFAQEYLAEYRTKQGLVYKEFQRQRHIFNEADYQKSLRLGGIDFGYSNPAAVLTIEKDANGHYWVLEEWYKTEKTHEQIAEYVANQDYNRVYPDPASPEAIKVIEQKGVNVIDVNKGKDSIQTGISRVRELFKQGRLHIHADCKHLIWEIENYEYPEKRLNNPEPEVPIKENDHALDALRYVIMTDMYSEPRRQRNRNPWEKEFIRRANVQAPR